MLSSRPLVSVVLPTYNGARYLAESVQSVIAQTFQDWELIIVDDCSTDETPQIIEHFVQQDPRIRSIRHETNRKLPAALNTGFADARGEFFTWTSDDNLFARSALSEMYDLLVDQPATDVVYCDLTIIDSEGNVTGTRPLCSIERIVYGNIVGACFMYRRAVHHALGGYDEDFYLAEDYDFWLRAATQFRLAYLNRNLYFYRSHGQSLSTTRAADVGLVMYRALRRTLPLLPGLDSYTRAHGYLVLASAAWKRGDVGAARSHLLRAIWRLPRTVWKEHRELLGAFVPFKRRRVDSGKP